MSALLQRIRASLVPGTGVGGRVRFVSASILFAGLLWLLFAAKYAPDDTDDFGIVFLFVVGISAILGYFLYFAFVLFCWVLSGFDESTQLLLFRFALLMIVVSASITFATMFRYETIDWHRDSDTCWNMTRDRWTDKVSTRTMTCPPKPEPRGKIVPV